MPDESDWKVIPAFNPLYTNEWDIFGAEGGRGSGKSIQIADYVIGETSRRQVRALCCREVQESINESVFETIKERIEERGRTSEYDILKTSITNRFYNGKYLFHGLQDHTAESIKSYANVDICWIEEAQSVTKHSLDILLPTIRKDGSKILMSYNRQDENDACHEVLMRGIDSTEKLFYVWKEKLYSWFEHRGTVEIEDPETGEKIKRRKIVITINHDGNPFFPVSLEHQRLEAQADDPEVYPHIWEGQPVGSATYAIIPRVKLNAAVTREVEFNVDDIFICGVDQAGLGRDRTIAYLKRGQKGIELRQWKGIEGPAIADQLELMCTDHKIPKHLIQFNCDDTGLADLAAIMVSRGYQASGISFSGKAKDSDTYPNIASELWFTSRQNIDTIQIVDDPELLDELAKRRWKPNTGGKRVVEPKEDYKKREKKSPDKADAFNLAHYDYSYMHLKPGQSLAGISAY